MTPDPVNGAWSFFTPERRQGIERLSPYLWISLGAIVGANLRYIVNRALAHWFGTGFPYGTFAVNISGSLAIGVLGAMIAARLVDRPEVVREVAVIGFLGSLTTFSSFMYETHSLFNDGAWIRALANLLLSIVAGLAGVRLGIYLAERFGGSP
jgi:CrcB protein